MKKVLITGILAILLSINLVFAQELVNPGLLPDNPFYTVKTFFEKVRLWLTFDPEARARFHTFLAELRLSELNATIVKGKLEYIGRLKNEFENEINETEREINRTIGLGRNVTVLAEYVSNMTYKHILVLERVLAKVPEQAKSAIEHAINVSIRGHEQAVESILARINKTIEEVRKVNCTSDVDCRDLFCPMVLGNDTPVCQEGKCKCGGKWEILNRTEWKERFREEYSNITEKIHEIWEEKKKD